MLVNLQIETKLYDLPNPTDYDFGLRLIINRAVTQIKKQIRQRRSWNGQYYKGLTPKTIKDKKRLGVKDVNTPLIRTGLLINSIVARKTHGGYSVIILPQGKPHRNTLAIIHQLEGVNKHTRVKRPFFGLSKKFHKDSLKYMSKIVKSLTAKKAGRKIKHKRKY